MVAKGERRQVKQGKWDAGAATRCLERAERDKSKTKTRRESDGDKSTSHKRSEKDRGL